MIVYLFLQQETAMCFKSPLWESVFSKNQIHVQIKCENLIKWKVWLKWRNKALHVYKHTS